MIDATRARRIRLVAMDVDGTMTDGGIYIGMVAGEKVEFKRFDIQDGMGMKLLQLAGLKTAMITGRAGDASRLRAEELKVDDFVVAGGRKRAKVHAFEEILEKHGIAWEESCFIGDDLIDIPIMQRAGLPVAVANAVEEVRAIAAFTTSKPGGSGAVREVAEALLRARGEWDQLVETYISERSHERVG
jgi:3-deoxy-D-manno-octulosonate 8-phosphate phosphatase (KDO 8-P phosphatase)